MVVAIPLLIAACGGSSGNGTPAGPSGASPAPLAPNPCASAQTCGDVSSIGVWISIRNGGESDPWSLTFGEFTRTGTGNAEYGFVNVAPGEHEVSGQFSTGASFDITFGRNRSTVPGGITPSSLRSLEGPVVQVSTIASRCGVQYARPNAGASAVSVNFRVAFAVSGSSSQGTC